jgi:hypothetical protein
MTEHETAVKVKINSIQEYIFMSNKLKENIGASQITDKEVFHVTMNEILEIDFTGKYKPGDIGGGGAIVLFDNATIAKDFIKEFSKEILLKYPGLKTSFAVIPDFEYSKHKYLLDDLLSDNKSMHHVNTTIQKHGISADCPWSNESAEEWRAIEKQHLSKVAISKIEMVEKSLERYKPILDKNSNYLLTDEVDKLGQNKEAGYIAVVHVDGNGMGDKIDEIESLEKLSERSNDIREARDKAMEGIINDLIDLLDNGKVLKEIKLHEKGDKYYLPVRPILSGGDDITFVCEGRLGMFLAEKFVEYISEMGQSKLMNGACAGVAIVKTKFPFYKAYQLAEELCKEAKEKCRGTQKSYLSYYYSATTFSGSLEKLRERTHKLSKDKDMYFGPYNIYEPNDPHSIHKLKAGIKYLMYGGVDDKGEKLKFPKNKVMRLREVIAESISSQKLFLKELSEADIKLPGHDEKPDKTTELWTKEKRTPYFDQIELMDFYLEGLL